MTVSSVTHSPDIPKQSLSATHARHDSSGKLLTPWAVGPTKILLLENVNSLAVELLRGQGYGVDEVKTALNEHDLIEKIKSGGYSGLGIRSKTKVTAKVIKEVAGQLLVIGCFCIGTNQVDLTAAASAGISVFNSPFSNSRSVAELVIGEVIALSRQLFDRSAELHRGVWNKLSKGCWEVRGKTLGIVGYGHIGSQLSVLAEAMGMSVVYHDVVPIMPLGSARQMSDLEEMLSVADFVTLHVPELPETIGMISTAQLAQMKPESFLINNARGQVVDIPALVKALKTKQLAGAALDVYPNEPAGNGEHFNDELNSWTSELQELPNVILTPHIGGSTEEAQRAIGAEVAQALIRYLTFGSSIGAVNFPEVTLRPILATGYVRVCHVHQNQPGVLKNVNSIVGDYNVEKQYSDSRGDIAYLLADIQVSQLADQ
ncbi:uncharacterized protein MELLADRAFT_92254 [Melampsora larici-populina 98AG31]|uniref:Phosphoglycerate dehydrogenase n=1 Tax=Melampsora larici-populina (strain 98AG31 / pathotype 3-4-7) TaxID=747676 RepID=F4R8Z0_MELLP|nr:uncharacterized protein MELLADRAFT_92254 [Melampsora larici-populina 98AG31]EGG11246.1 hypothetical protein MELLADRAFT_92254 [Melampsora larici-populina 98AG31]